MTSADLRVMRSPSASAAAAAAAHAVVDLIATARTRGGTCHIAVAGGTTPALMYRRIADAVNGWSGIRIWLGDERYVPPTAPDANAHLVMSTLLARLTGDIPTPLQTVRTELPLVDAARDYEERLLACVPLTEGVPILDLVILGVGEDGHTASLFPEREDLLHPASTSIVIPVTDAPKPPPDRVSMTLQAINAARARLILATGPGKREPLARFVAGERTDRFPITLIERGGTVLHTDQLV